MEKMEKKIPLQTVERMSLYRRILEELHGKGVANVYSHQLAEMVHVSPAQLRRDLASFGSFGNISRGYPVYQMIVTISRLFGTDTLQNVALVGVGNLGRALLFYRGFEERGFHIAVVFDIDSEKVGRVFAGRRCHHIQDLEAVLPDYSITMAILACGQQNLQSMVNRLGQAGVRSVLNFVPKQVHGPAGVNVENVDFAARLEKLSFLNRFGSAR
ncbi:MAG: redox-sensing transcriptional repressor Rex [Deltaproteobacteria bacterium]|nr:redox-sensing transcriptional repressor Rex [Deltaproteobacteria bacterium]